MSAGGSDPFAYRVNGRGNTKEFLFKILVIGELGTGKTSFIKRYVHQFFSDHYRATIGVDFALKVLQWDEDGTVVRLQLWDIAGQERFGNMTRVYYKEAVGAILVYDLTRKDTFAAVDKWKTDLDSKVILPDGRNIPCVLVGNKCDQKDAEEIDRDSPIMSAFCKQRGFIGWFATSAKANTNVEDACKFLVDRILENDKWTQHGENMQARGGDYADNDGVNRLSQRDLELQKDKKFKCCS